MNNDWSKQEPFTPSSSIRINKAQGLLYRRNTLSVAGNAQGFSANRYIPGNGRRFIPNQYDPSSIPNIVCEFNLHLACGLQHTDGSSMYIPDAHMMESVIRYNWFIGNGQRDFRWDGNNKPLQGVYGNLYRNVALDTGVKKMSPSGGNGFRVKGDFHEVYHNLGLGRGAELNIATEKGGNSKTLTYNNAATHFTDQPIPGISSNNFIGRKDRRNLKTLVRDFQNWDFRPRADAVELIDQGRPVSCSIQGKDLAISTRYHGQAPDLGAYEDGDALYWIPGRQEAVASTPIPKDGSTEIALDVDLMYLIGLGGARAHVYAGTHPDTLKQITSLSAYENIVPLAEKLAIKRGQRYYWRVDTERSDGSLEPGPVWTFTTVSEVN